jgi:hypothetical protein
MFCIHNDKHSFEFGCYENVSRSCSTSVTCRIIGSLHEHHRYENRIGPQYVFIYIYLLCFTLCSKVSPTTHRIPPLILLYISSRDDHYM